MTKKIAFGVASALLLLVSVAAVGLGRAHVAIRRENALLPPVQEVSAALSAADAPVSLRWINTASQAMPRSAVLDSRRDPNPGAAYVMAHSAFVLEWSDGRLLLIDTGMNREGALAFGGPIETFAGGEPIRPLPSVAETLGPSARRVAGVVFTHLHTDHVGGIADLCRAAGGPIGVFMTEAQAERPNYTTRPGLDLLEDADCVRRETLHGPSPLSVPGFPGVLVIAAGGHTPGSQIVAARVESDGGARQYVFAGDIVNNIDGIEHDVPKPFLYRLLVVPEAEGRQAELRGFLRRLRDAGGAQLLVSHDQRQLEEALGRPS